MTEEILGRMRTEGFTVYDGGPVRFDPLPWDINNGRCEQWAELAAERLDGPSFTQWIEPFHCVLFYRGKWYDADCLDGEVDWENLPMITNPGLDRPEPLCEEENVRWLTDVPTSRVHLSRRRTQRMRRGMGGWKKPVST